MNVAARTNTNGPVNHDHDTTPGPGSLLKDARVAAGLSLLDVAAKLHLDQRVVTALEEDKFDALPAATFVRGYLRSYTQLLGLPAGPVLEAFSNEGLSPPVLIADISEDSQTRSDDISMRLVSYGVIVVLTIMVVLWWHNQDFDYQDLLQTTTEVEPGDSLVIEPLATDVTQDAPTTVLEDNPSQSFESAENTEISLNSAPEPEATPQTNTEGLSTAAVPTLSSVSDAISESGTEGVSDVSESLDQQLSEAQDSIEASREVLSQSQALTDPQAPATPSTETTTTATRSTTQPQDNATLTPANTENNNSSSSNTEQTTTTQSTPTPTSEGQDSLTMHFTRESWVTVYDSIDTRLYYGLTQPDQTLQVQGQKPLRVVIGRPQGVTLQYNGKPMDLKPHISSSGVARFTGNP